MDSDSTALILNKWRTWSWQRIEEEVSTDSGIIGLLVIHFVLFIITSCDHLEEIRLTPVTKHTLEHC